MRVINAILVVLFVVAAILQYNDPDPYLWVPIYLFGALLCFQAIRGNFNLKLYALGLIFYTAYAIFLVVDKWGVLTWIKDHHAESITQSMKAEQPWIEETREFFGLVILIVALIANLLWHKKTRSRQGI